MLCISCGRLATPAYLRTDGFPVYSFSAEAVGVDHHHSCRVIRLTRVDICGMVVLHKTKSSTKKEHSKPRAGAYP